MIRETSTANLLVGDAISARDIKQLYDLRIAAVVDVAANEQPAVLGRDLIYCRFPLSDDDANERAIIVAAISSVRSLLQHEFRTLVACSAGMSRSPVIAAAALSNSRRTLSESLADLELHGPLDVSPALFASVDEVLRETHKNV